MRFIPVSMLIVLCTSCATSAIVATYSNRNVYKTKSALKVNKVYRGRLPETDLADYYITPEIGLVVTKTETTVTTTQNTSVRPSETTTKVVTETIPGTITSVATTGPANATNATTETKTITYSSSIVNRLPQFIRYQVVADEGDYKYIRVLPGCRFTGASTIEFGASPSGQPAPEDFVFRVLKKDLVPNTHYLASSALIGKITTIPVRIRNEYWNGDNKVLQGTLAIGYSFGWKYKLGNHPYRPHYLTTILYGAGVSQQKYFSKTGIDENGKAILSEKTDEIALTYLSFGLAYEFDKFNIGLFAGKDRMFGNRKDWVYQKEWWWGLGVGYDVFK